MSSDSKYSLGESALIFSGIPVLVVLVLIFVATLLTTLFFAWVKSEIWNWFAVPYFHLPVIGTWLMFVITIFVGCFTPSRSLKEEYYADASWKYLGGQVLAYLLVLLEAYCIHHWILKG